MCWLEKGYSVATQIGYGLCHVCYVTPQIFHIFWIYQSTNSFFPSSTEHMCCTFNFLIKSLQIYLTEKLTSRKQEETRVFCTSSLIFHFYSGCFNEVMLARIVFLIFSTWPHPPQLVSYSRDWRWRAFSEKFLKLSMFWWRGRNYMPPGSPIFQVTFVKCVSSRNVYFSQLIQLKIFNSTSFINPGFHLVVICKRYLIFFIAKGHLSFFHLFKTDLMSPACMVSIGLVGRAFLNIQCGVEILHQPLPLPHQLNALFLQWILICWLPHLNCIRELLLRRNKET